MPGPVGSALMRLVVIDARHLASNVLIDVNCEASIWFSFESFWIDLRGGDRFDSRARLLAGTFICATSVGVHFENW